MASVVDTPTHLLDPSHLPQVDGGEDKEEDKEENEETDEEEEEYKETSVVDEDEQQDEQDDHKYEQKQETRKYKCYKCEMEFGRVEMMDHVLEQHQNQCDQCSESFKSLSALIQHMRETRHCM